jgi:hypothetical protein
VQIKEPDSSVDDVPVSHPEEPHNRPLGRLSATVLAVLGGATLVIAAIAFLVFVNARDLCDNSAIR